MTRTRETSRPCPCEMMTLGLARGQTPRFSGRFTRPVVQSGGAAKESRWT